MERSRFDPLSQAGLYWNGQSDDDDQAVFATACGAVGSRIALRPKIATYRILA